MSDQLSTALKQLEALDTEQAARLLSAFAAIPNTDAREDVVKFAERLAGLQSGF